MFLKSAYMILHKETIKGIPQHMHTGNLMSVPSYRAGSGISDYTGLVATVPNGLLLRPRCPVQ